MVLISAAVRHKSIQSLRAGSMHLTKPVQPNELLVVIGTLIEGFDVELVEVRTTCSSLTRVLYRIITTSGHMYE